MQAIGARGKHATLRACLVASLPCREPALSRACLVAIFEVQCHPPGE